MRLTRSPIVIKNILDPTAGRENTSSVAREIISDKFDGLCISFKLVAASNGLRVLVIFSTWRSRLRPGGKNAFMGRSIGLGCLAESRSVSDSLAPPFSSLETTFPTTEKPHRSLPV